MPEPQPDNPTFEQALTELERIVHELEDGQIGLEDSLARYEKGINLLKRCYGQLREAEQRILLLTGVDEEGKPLARPFQHASTEGVEAKAPRPERKPERAESKAETAERKPRNNQAEEVRQTPPELPF